MEGQKGNEGVVFKKSEKIPRSEMGPEEKETFLQDIATYSITLEYS